VEGGGGGLTMSGVSRNRGSFVKYVAIQKRLGIPGLAYYHVHKTLDLILCQLNQIHNLTSQFFKIHINIILLSVA
jgi:hypothetical protein